MEKTMKNACIVGYGSIAPVHANAIQAAENANLYAVCDTDDEAINRCRLKYDVVPYTNYDNMLRDINIDVVHICTPHYLHYPMIEKALEHGKKVVCEKPVTMTKNEFEKLLQIKNSNDVCVIFQNRYNNCVQKLKELIDNGELGELRAVKGILTWLRDTKYYMGSAWKGKLSTEGGGVLINQAVHTLDLMIYLIGSVIQVEASMATHNLKNIIEVEDTLEAYLKFSNGAVGTFYATNTYPGGIDFGIIGSKSTANYTDSKLFVDGELVADDMAPNGGKIYWGAGHKLLLSNFYDKNEYFTPHDIVDTMNTLFSIYESARQGREVNIGEDVI